MKNYKIYIPILVFVFTLGSCQKYLDIKRSGTDKFIETADDCQKLLDRYLIMNTNYPSDGQASSDDFYLATNRFPGDLDQENQEIYKWTASAIHKSSDPQWVKPYQTVYWANLVLEALDRQDVKNSTDAGTLNNIKGVALFFRAYALWNVAQLYAKPYGANAAQDPGVPARTSPDLNDVFGRGTVKESYDRIIQDLTDAVSLLNPTSLKPTRPNKSSAYAMLARVYLSMEDYGNALTNASAAITGKTLINYSSLDLNSETPFAQFNDEVLFQSLIASMDVLSPGDANNPGARINNELYNMYDNNDLRKVIFFKPNSVTVSVNDPTQQGRVRNVTVNDGTYRFTGNYDPTNQTVLFNGLTVDEMYLTRAECYARSGDFSSAMKDLRTLLVTRFKKGPGTTNTYVDPVVTNADQALAIVLDERRKELVMRGQRWTDLRRLNKDPKYKKDLKRDLVSVNAVSTGTYPNQTISITYPITTSWTLPANDLRYTLLIPKEVIDNTKMQQNPR